MTDKEQSKLAGKHVLVLGAGYVGSAMLERLAGTGARLSALTRNPAVSADLRARGARVLCMDLASEDWHAELPEGADFVLNCVGSGGGGVEAYRHSYVDGMASLLRWSQSAPVGHIVYTSSVSVYAADGGALVDEEAELLNDGGPASLLHEAERTLLGSSSCRARRHVLRLAGIYGPGRHHFLDQLASNAVVAGSADRHLNLIHRDDIVSAVLAAWLSPSSVADMTFNVVDDGAATRKEIADWLTKRLGLPPTRFTGDPRPGIQRGARDRIISNRLIKSILAWSPVFPSFREGYGVLLSARPA